MLLYYELSTTTRTLEDWKDHKNNKNIPTLPHYYITKNYSKN